MLQRILALDLPEQQSIFLWGARQTGKSFFLHKNITAAIYYDLLDTHEFIRLSKEPYILREEILALDPQQLKLPIIIDEIQKIPDLLNEVHWLIENAQAKFILCGSSARQLKNVSTNLLGGRAWKYNFYPLVFAEVPKFDLLRALQHGMLPKHYLSSAKFIHEYLRSYVEVYLAEEIRNEGLVRNLSGFARFLDVVGINNTEMINLTNIARDCGVDRSTVQGYYQILLDTMLGYNVYPYSHKVKREIIQTVPKFYFFDVGIGNYLSKQNISSLVGAQAGHALENYILQELVAYRGINRKQFEITYWRTKTGLEVDFILGDAVVAIEVKLSTAVHKEDLKGLIAFCAEHPRVNGIVVSLDKRPRELTIGEDSKILIWPCITFLEKLWQGLIF
jgi:uncharacterized protein